MANDARVKSLNRHLRTHDKALFCRRGINGVISVYRKTTRWDEFFFCGARYLYSRHHPEFIFSLTHDWTHTGKPVEWGIEPLLGRLKEIDGWNRGDQLLDDLIHGYERGKERDIRDRKNRDEAFLYDFHGQFKKATSDINTSTLEKVDSRRNENGSRK